MNGNAVVSSFQISVISWLASRMLEMQRALADLHHRLDADRLPVLRDKLRHVGPGAERRHDADLDRRRLAVVHQPDALRIALRQAERVEHLVGLVAIELGVFRGPFLAGEIRMPRRRHGLPGLAQAEKHRLLDLVAIDRERQRDPEVLRRHQLADRRIGRVGHVEGDHRIRAAEGRPGDDAVLAVLLLLLQHRIVGHLDVPRLHVEVAGDGRQVQRLLIGEVGEPDLVDVGQLIAGRDRRR